MDDEWAEHAAEWDDQPGTRAYAAAAFDSLGELVRASNLDLEGARVVDFGCGTGLLTAYLVEAGSHVVALDNSPAMLDELASKIEHEGWGPVVTTASSLDEVPAGHDLIVCSSVCSFLDDYPATVRQLVDRLRPGGVFVQWDWEDEGDGHGLTRSGITTTLTGVGLERVEVTTGFEIAIGGSTMRPLRGHGRRP